MKKADSKVISGGDGYEDFSSSASSDLAGDQIFFFYPHSCQFKVIRILSLIVLYLLPLLLLLCFILYG